jgi:O-Antigen ligase
MPFLRKVAPHLYLFGLAALVAGMPLWILLISLSQFVLIGAWLFDGNIKMKLKSAFTNPVFLVIAGIYIMHIAGLIFTSDFKYAVDDLRVKMPLIILPLVISTMPPLPVNKFNLILKILLISTLASTIYSTAVWLGYTSVEVRNIRDISVFISHIRLSLIICMCLVIIVYLLRSEKNTFARTGLYMLATWFIVFLFILQSLTGICILLLFTITAILYSAWKSKQLITRAFAVLFFTATIMAGINLFDYLFISSIKRTTISDSMLLQKTELGNAYEHDLKNYEEENNHPVWINICEKELDSAWNLRSSLKYKGTDNANQSLHSTLIRFLASKNIPRDAAGVNSLSNEEVKAIENGIANVEYMQGSTIATRMKQLAWEYRSYYYSGNPSGHSIMQRFEFWKTGYYIFKKNPLTGTGTGDIKNEYALAYQETNTHLANDFRLRAHNEYLTMFITFGIFGGCYFIFAMLYPWFRLRKKTDLLYTAALVIILLSMVMEDTPESQAGATIMAFFNSFFLFHHYGKRENK